MSNDKMREAFEEQMVNLGHFPEGTEFTQDGEGKYIHNPAQVAWEAAQWAALTQQTNPQVPEGWESAFEEEAEEWTGDHRGAAIVALKGAKAKIKKMLAAPSIAEKREWINCEDRLPTEEDADMSDHVFVANEFDIDVSIWSDLRNPAYRQNWSHWMPTGLARPEPPVSGGE